MSVLPTTRRGSLGMEGEEEEEQEQVPSSAVVFHMRCCGNDTGASIDLMMEMGMAAAFT